MNCFGIVYSGKLQSSQVVCTPRSSRCKIRFSIKTVCANDIQRFYRVILSQHNVTMELLYKKLTGPGPEISLHPGVTFFLFFFSLFFVTFFLKENLEAACFTDEHST